MLFLFWGCIIALLDGWATSYLNDTRDEIKEPVYPTETLCEQT